MRLSVSFLIILRAPTTTGTVVVLICHISVSIPRSFYLLILLYSLTDKLAEISVRNYVFLLYS